MVSDHKRHSKLPKMDPEVARTLDGMMAGELIATSSAPEPAITRPEPDVQAISKLLMAVYRSGATGTPRNLKNDLAALTALYNAGKDTQQ